MTDDALRRKVLNEERNPRVTQMNEATQTIDPITGKPYLENFEVALFAETDPGFFKKIYQKGDAVQRSALVQLSTFIEYQLALARKDVRESRMGRMEYARVRKNVDSFLLRMHQAGIPVDVISSPEGLDRAIRAESSRSESDVHDEDLRMIYVPYIRTPISKLEEPKYITRPPARAYHYTGLSTQRN